MRSAPLGAQSRCTSMTKAPRLVVNCALKMSGAFSFSRPGDRRVGWTLEARSPTDGAVTTGAAGGEGGVGGLTEGTVAALALGSGTGSEPLQQSRSGNSTKTAERTGFMGRL